MYLNFYAKLRAKKRGRRNKSKVLNLICRLENYKASVCLFIWNLCVPFDNDQTERDLRMIKVKTKDELVHRLFCSIFVFPRHYRLIKIIGEKA